MAFPETPQRAQRAISVIKVKFYFLTPIILPAMSFADQLIQIYNNSQVNAKTPYATAIISQAVLKAVREQCVIRARGTTIPLVAPVRSFLLDIVTTINTVAAVTDIPPASVPDPATYVPIPGTYIPYSTADAVVIRDYVRTQLTAGGLTVALSGSLNLAISW
jgi:hypothetical protein